MRTEVELLEVHGLLDARIAKPRAGLRRRALSTSTLISITIARRHTPYLQDRTRRP